MQHDKKNIQIPNIEPVKFVERSNGSIKGYAANTFHGLVKDFNEDRVSIIMNITKPNHKGKWPKCSYFAVFDGHGGHLCSDFLKDNMHKYITQSQYFPHEPIEALKAGFRKAEIQFVKLAESKTPLERSGSCALVILIIDQMCYIANVGDSRAILSYQSGAKVFALSHDHKPETSTEKQRIINAGGKVYQSMLKTKLGLNVPGPFRLVPGKLSVSRSFGDIEAKIEKYGGNPKVLIAKPQITYFQIDPNNHDYIMMGSDGIFDKLTNQQIIKCFWQVHDKSQKKNNQYIGQAASRIITSAMKNLSMDNLTSVLIMFDDEKRLEIPRKKAKNIQKVLQNNSNLKKFQNFNHLNIEDSKKQRGLSSKMIEKMTLKRKSIVSSANTSHKIEPSKKSMKNLRKQPTWKTLPTNKSDIKENDLVKFVKTRQIDKIR